MISKEANVRTLSVTGYPALDMHVYTFGAVDGGPVCTLCVGNAFMARPLNVILVESKSEGRRGVRVRSVVRAFLVPSLSNLKLLHLRREHASGTFAPEFEIGKVCYCRQSERICRIG